MKINSYFPTTLNHKSFNRSVSSASNRFPSHHSSSAGSHDCIIPHTNPIFNTMVPIVCLLKLQNNSFRQYCFTPSMSSLWPPQSDPFQNIYFMYMKLWCFMYTDNFLYHSIRVTTNLLYWLGLGLGPVLVIIVSALN